jgi:eukaryotic-like serine/threonine-protein kinase
LVSQIRIMPLKAGAHLGRYEIRSQLGAGGMGEVYLSWDSQLERNVALKVLTADVAADPQRMRRFIQEAKAASALNHQNILTIYEIGEADSHHFIATEHIEGETLRQYMTRARMTVGEALDVAVQVASALTAAHAAGITHRDIKPENIMVRRDRLVKVLDFGLVKLTEHKSLPTDMEARTKTLVQTDAGTVMGTAQYMSPEQARGLEVDARTDIWSLGVVLYEMVAGHPPFTGETATDIIASIVKTEPPPLARYAPEVPTELEWFITKALAKDRDERYQVIKDMLLDLRGMKHKLEFEAELDRSVPPEMRSGAAAAAVATMNSGQAGATAHQLAAPTAEAQSPHPTSSAEYIVTEIKRHKRGAIVTLAALVLAMAAIFFYYYNRAPALTERDTILLTDFVNTTGDAVFDGTLRQALAVQLGQSPYLNIFPEQRIRETLRYMNRSPDERVTREIGREICQRQGIKALLVGSISGLGNHYVITLEAINAQTGEALAREQAEAESKEQVLRKLGEAATSLREKLGESLASIQRFDAPVEQATTSSLEALRAFSLGDEHRARGEDAEAIPFYRRAIELDPNFALAYARLAVMYFNLRQFEQASQYSQRAFELRDRVSERERFYLESRYYGDVTGELEKNLEVLELWKRTYPRDFVPLNNLAVAYSGIGQYERAIEEARAAIQLNPTSAAPRTNLGFAFMGLNRFDEARAVFEEALRQNPDSTSHHIGLYFIAFIHGNTSAMQQQVEWARGRPTEHDITGVQASAAAFSGRLRQSRELSRRAVELAQQRELREVAAVITLQAATREALFGNCQQAREYVTNALTLARSRTVLSRAAAALALCGEANLAQPLIDELSRRFPQDTLINVTWLPTIRAALEINRNNPAQAVQLLQTASRYELERDAGLAPIYIRGLAYLRLQQGAEAMAEFQKILDHRGVASASPIRPLAHLGLARAAALTGDIARSRRAYQDFFALWREADADIPILQEARQEYERLR